YFSPSIGGAGGCWNGNAGVRKAVVFLHEQIQWLQIQANGVQVVLKSLIIPYTLSLSYANTHQVKNQVLTSSERRHYKTESCCA
ncbi:MAG TPA: hypothetical protein V6C91_21365, partial [Coleofasciculaceae cyanobacterium]